jgi:hypothetical protein
VFDVKQARIEVLLRPRPRPLQQILKAWGAPARGYFLTLAEIADGNDGLCATLFADFHREVWESRRMQAIALADQKKQGKSEPVDVLPYYAKRHARIKPEEWAPLRTVVARQILDRIKVGRLPSVALHTLAFDVGVRRGGESGFLQGLAKGHAAIYQNLLGLWQEEESIALRQGLPQMSHADQWKAGWSAIIYGLFVDNGATFFIQVTFWLLILAGIIYMLLGLPRPWLSWLLGGGLIAGVVLHFLLLLGKSQSGLSLSDSGKYWRQQAPSAIPGQRVASILNPEAWFHREPPVGAIVAFARFVWLPLVVLVVWALYLVVLPVFDVKAIKEPPKRIQDWTPWQPANHDGGKR